MLGLHTVLTIIACAGLLVLAVLGAVRAQKDALALPFGLFAADLLVWNLASCLHELTGEPRWRALDVAFSPFTPALGLHFVLTFVGRRRALARLLRAAYAYFGLLAAASMTAFLLGGGASARIMAVWPYPFLAGVVVAIVAAARLLAAHYRASDQPEERARTTLLFIALPLGAVFGATDLAAEIAPSVPPLASIGTLLAALLMTFVTFRMRLFGLDVSRGEVVAVIGLALIGLGGHLVAVRVIGSSSSALVVATGAIVFAVVLAGRKLVLAGSAERARLYQLSTLGSFSAQLAHDLKNPLAAMKGAADFLKQERKEGRSLDDSAEFLDLIADQIERLRAVIDDYQRMSRLEPALAKADVNAVIRRVLALQSFASTANITVKADLDPSLPEARLDSDLFQRALENLAQNGLEAMPEGGTLTVRTRRAEEGDRAIEIEVEDDGPGMDARTRERAFDDHFTTKPRGTGLGLPFVRRVLVAHGGGASIHRGSSNAARPGTIVQLWLPKIPPAQ